MIEEEPPCPECGNPLTGIRVMKDKRGKITIEFFCDEGGEDLFNFQIVTGLTDKDIGRLKEKGKAIPKEMAVRLIERKSEERATKTTIATSQTNSRLKKCEKPRSRVSLCRRKD